MREHASDEHAKSIGSPARSPRRLDRRAALLLDGLCSVAGMGDADVEDSGGEQLELMLGPLYVVTVDDRVSGPLTSRPARRYRSPPQALEEARCLALLLLDRSEELADEGPWRRPLPGGQRHVAIVRAPAGSIG